LYERAPRRRLKLLQATQAGSNVMASHSSAANSGRVLLSGFDATVIFSHTVPASTAPTSQSRRCGEVGACCSGPSIPARAIAARVGP
jgi:hypothetical protein